MNQEENNPVIPQAGFTNPAANAAPAVPTTPAPAMPVAPEPIAPTPAPTPEMPSAPAPAPEMPTAPAPTPETSPAPAPTPAPQAPVTPDVPTIDPSLLQQAIADVPEEAATTASEAPAPVDLNATPSLETTPETPAAETSPFTTAAPTADLTSPEPAPATTTAESVEAPKATPSVAFNDPAQEPDAKPKKPVKTPAFIEKLKKNPVALIVIGATVIIVALILIIAFAI